MSRERGMAEPISQKGRGRIKMGIRIPKSSCKVRMDTNRKRVVQKEVLNILYAHTAKNTFTRALETPDLKLIPGQYLTPAQ